MPPSQSAVGYVHVEWLRESLESILDNNEDMALMFLGRRTKPYTLNLVFDGLRQSLESISDDNDVPVSKATTLTK